MAGKGVIQFAELRAKNALTVLSVDNYGNETRTYRNFIRDLGFRVLEAEDGVQAIKLCRLGAAFDIIIINMDLADHEGPQLAMYLREMGVHSKLVGFTCEKGGQIQAYLHGGLDYCLEKPINFWNLAALLQQIEDDY